MSRFKECGFFPFSINDTGDFVILFRSNAKGPNPTIYEDFGSRIDKYEPSILFSAIRGFMTKSFGIFSEFVENQDLDEINLHEGKIK